MNLFFHRGVQIAKKIVNKKRKISDIYLLVAFYGHFAYYRTIVFVFTVYFGNFQAF
jgi:hypothetical protein